MKYQELTQEGKKEWLRYQAHWFSLAYAEVFERLANEWTYE